MGFWGLGKPLLALLIAVGAAAAQESAEGERPEPFDEGITEAVEVRLVILDTLVLDRKGRTISDLSQADFELLIDHELHPIDTFDVICPAGNVSDPKGVNEPGRREPPAAAAHPRQVIFAVDYLNLAQIERYELLEQLQEMVRHGGTEDEEIMIVALADDVRVELPFTTDREAAIETFKRMQYDISLWLPRFDRLTLKRFFLNLRDLLELLETVPDSNGSKAMLFFSNQPTLSALDRDHEYRAIAAGAIASRTAIYPVHAKGLQAPDRTDPTSVFAGGPPILARLAVETGGRFTRNTNDLSLGYARAQRDLACRYAVGFYADADIEKTHLAVLRVKREGLHAYHPASYQFRSDAEKREAKLRAALIEPELFADGTVRAHLFPLRPVSSSKWEVLLVVEFPVPDFANYEGEPTRDIGLTITKGGHPVKKLDWRVTLNACDRDHRGRVTAVERVRLGPGEYTLSAVVSDPQSDVPGTDVAALSLSGFPRGQWVLVGPLLGWPSMPVSSSEAPLSPVLVHRIPIGTALQFVTRLCAVGSGAPEEPAVAREITRGTDEAPLELPDPGLSTDGSGKVRCRSLIETLPTEKLGAGDYLYEVYISDESGLPPRSRSLRFSIEAP